MNIQLVTIIKIAGWILTAAPLAAFLIFSIIMLKEISKDDDSLVGLINMAFVIFVIGIVLLLAAYLGTYFAGSSGSIS